jgi:integrase
MPAKRKGAHLWLRRERIGRDGTRRKAVWIIRDGDSRHSTGCAESNIGGAETALKKYLADKHTITARAVSRRPAGIPIADVLNIYARDKAPEHARLAETVRRIEALRDYFGTATLSTINGHACRAYVQARGEGAGRRELEELRAAINHHRREGLCSEIVEVVLPPRGAPRERWLSRAEAARLIKAAWRYHERQDGAPSDRRPRQHVARFALIALYTGSRAGVICEAALGRPQPGRGWIDLDRGVFYRRAPGKRESKKRAPPVPLPPSLLAHLRRWHRSGQAYAVEWNGAPVVSLRKAFAAAVKDAGLGLEVTPHVLRHTAATWLMQAGVDMWQVAGFLGMTVEMISQRYGHHHPGHLAGAVEAFSTHRAKRASIARRA